MGRMDFASCKTIEKSVLDKEQMTVVFFGPEEKLWNTGNYTHLARSVALDRSRNTEEPMLFLQNDAKACKVKAAGLDAGIHLVIFHHSSDEPIILSESNEKDLEILKDPVRLTAHMDMAVVRINRKWGARAYWSQKLIRSQMITYVKGIREEDSRLEMHFFEGCDMLREKKVMLTCLTAEFDDKNLHGLFPDLKKHFDASFSSIFYMDMEGGIVKSYPLDVHQKQIRRKNDPTNILIWARYYQAKSVINNYKKQLKSTYTKTDEESRALAKKIRTHLEQAVLDLDEYANLLDKNRIPYGDDKKLKQGKKDKRGTARESRDAADDREAYYAAKRAQEEDEEVDLDDLSILHEAAEAKKELLRMQKEGFPEVPKPEDETKDEDKDNKEEDNKEEQTDPKGADL